ncbi:MAG TPA: hypothetical protein VNA25_16780 [Phycisphaerae bacterium]|nr:hypothetical protein [Phycisphaerae bacterium]
MSQLQTTMARPPNSKRPWDELDAWMLIRDSGEGLAPDAAV